MFVLARVANLLRKASRWSLSRPQAPTSAGSCIPNPHALIRDRITSTTMSYLQIPGRRGPIDGTLLKKVLLGLPIIYLQVQFPQTAFFGFRALS